MDPSLFLIIVVIVVFVGLVLAWRSGRSKEILQKWADDNDYTLVSSRPCYLFKGPFFFVSDAQTVYFVTVRDAEGQNRSGWVRCGGFFFGLASNAAEVKWQ